MFTKNAWYTQGDNPENSNQWGPWLFVDSCGAVLMPPSVGITSPANGSSITQGNTINISAVASDTDGTVSKVEFYVGSTLLGTDTQSPYTASWTANLSGTFNIVAVATDNDGQSTTSEAVTIIVKPSGNNIAPTVELTSPVNGATFTEGETITVSANANDSDGTITSVEFLAGSTSLGIDTNAPYSISWSTASKGSYSITAIAIDNKNAAATSSTSSITVDSKTGNQLFLNSLPLQIVLNEGVSKVYKYDASIASILTRNKGIVEVQVADSQMTITGLKAGRTGLRINTASQSYFMGVRINHTDGSMPYLPKYVSVGSVSEDSQADLNFWKDVDIDLTNKEMDIRYIYINGGPINGWRTWGPQRVTKFATESMRFGLIPFFVYYNIPDGGESFDTDLAHIQDVTYMTAYFEDLNIFMDQAQDVLQGELYGIILEPDFLGYMQQNAEARLGTNKPGEIPTAVSATTIATNAGNVITLVERINKTINERRGQGHSIFFGWQLNLWSYAPVSGSRAFLRRTDDNDLGFTAGRAAIKESGEQTTLYGMEAGILSNGANFISIDKYGLDAGYSNPQDPFNSTWFFNNDHWMNYLYYVENMHLTSGMPIVLWQLPVGHINGSTMT
ncbi:MAG: hypothetical protein HC831_10890, partial [Chloroflexia bacterium]|nr:hypothetical protein [Chloroflexia bacterium]